MTPPRRSCDSTTAPSWSSRLASGPDGYYTKALPPGGSQVLTAKMTIPVHPTAYQYHSDIALLGTDGVPIEAVQLFAEQAAPAASIAYDLSVKAGSQKPVGNGQQNQIATAGTISATGTATFTAVLKNGTAFSWAMYFQVVNVSPCSNVTVTVKQGTTNVTAEALAGTYRTPLLGPGQSRTLKITFKPASGNTCDFFLWQARTGGSPGQAARSSTMLINLAG